MTWSRSDEPDGRVLWVVHGPAGNLPVGATARVEYRPSGDPQWRMELDRGAAPQLTPAGVDQLLGPA